MRTYLYPTFNLDIENFEKILPIAFHLTKELKLSCRYWQSGYWYAISFKDQAVNQGFYYAPKHEQEIIAAIKKDVDYQLTYIGAEQFTQGKELL